MKNSDVELLEQRIKALEKKLEESSIKNKSVLQRARAAVSRFFTRLFTKDNLGFVLSIISLVISSCVAGYLMFG